MNCTPKIINKAVSNSKGLPPISCPLIYLLYSRLNPPMNPKNNKAKPELPKKYNGLFLYLIKKVVVIKSKNPFTNLPKLLNLALPENLFWC